MVKPVVNTFNTIAPLIIQEYERYLPTAFDDSMTMLQKVNKIIKTLESLGKLTNDVVTQWNSVMEWVMGEGLDEGITERLDEMVADGSLSTLINQTLLESKADKTYVDSELQQNETYVNDKVAENKTYVDEQVEQNKVYVDTQVDNVNKRMDVSFLSNTLKRLSNKLDVKGVCFGDSLTYGSDVATGLQAINPYPYVLQSHLRNLYNYGLVEVVNAGYPGFRSDQLSAIVDSDVLFHQPDFVCVMMGTNDLLQGKEPDPLYTHLSDTVNKLLTNNVEVVVMSIPDVYTGHKDRVGLFNQVIKDVADRYRVPFVDINKHLNDYIVNKVYAPLELLPDGIHLKGSLYKYIADALIVDTFYQDVVVIEKDILVPAVKNRFVKTDCISVNKTELQTFWENYILRVGNTPNPSTGTFIRVLFYNKEKGNMLYCLGAKTSNGADKMDYDVNGNQGQLSFYSADVLWDFKHVMYDEMQIGLNIVTIKNTGNVTQFNDSYFNAFGVEKNIKPTALAPLNGWNQLSGYTRLSVRKEKNRIEFAGTISNTGTKTTPTILFTLPLEFRPLETVILEPNCESLNGNHLAQIFIYPNGNVELSTFNAGNWLSFDGLSYYVRLT